MFRRKKKDEKTEDAPVAAAAREDAKTAVEVEAPAATMAAAQSQVSPGQASLEGAITPEASRPAAIKASTGRGNRVQKVGIVSSDKMQKTVVVRVDRLVLHRKYRRYVRRTSRFMAHDDLGSTIGDRVRIVETRPLSARKRWRVVEIVQKAAK
ncbi:MAG TPA: 30S ribosomal protein S17 [Pyrinomonadaceae bacterium]|nr:30S ribosomal protein S17 [Pyrinomonadaceae bacterium]